MTEKSLHENVCDYIRLQYPQARFKTDLSGIYLGGKWSLLNHVKRTTSHSGFPDLIIYEPRGAYCGLAIELKAEGKSPFKKDGSLKKDDHIESQAAWMDTLQRCGFYAVFAVGFYEAKIVIDEYFKMNKK
jgi:hypothetical protein